VCALHSGEGPSTRADATLADRGGSAPLRGVVPGLQMGQCWLEKSNARELEERLDSRLQGRISLLLGGSRGEAWYNRSNCELFLGKFDLETVSGYQNLKDIGTILAHSGASKGLLPHLTAD